MLARARAQFDSSIERALTWEDFKAALDRKHMVLAPWCVLKGGFKVRGWDQGLG